MIENIEKLFPAKKTHFIQLLSSLLEKHWFFRLLYVRILRLKTLDDANYGTEKMANQII